MKYFIDEEFLNYSKKTLFNKPIPTIELISIGIVSEDGRKYYAISKDFNLKEAWNRYQIVNNNDNITIKARRKGFNYIYTSIIIPRKVYWLRDNVLKPIYDELVAKEVYNYKGFVDPYYELEFTYRNFKRLINKYGKTNKQIAEEIKDYVYYKSEEHKTYCCLGFDNEIKPEFYGYYSAFDYVVFSQLFGDFRQYPKGFQMYFIDLKQTLDEKAKLIPFGYTSELGLKSIRMSEDYPKQINKHNALQVAIWNKKLYEFLNKL